MTSEHHGGSEMLDTFAAAVVFYGQPDSDPDAVSAVSAPVLGLYGGSDRSIPAADVRALRDQARELEKSFEIVIYPDANHGFANPEDPRYDRDAATQAWRRVAEFLRQYLGSA